MRKKRRKAEKCYKRSKSLEDKEAFVKLRKKTTGLAFSKKQLYFSNKIKECPTTKALYSCIDRLLDRKEAEVLPSFDSPKELATQFNDFFKKRFMISGKISHLVALQMNRLNFLLFLF